MVNNMVEVVAALIWNNGKFMICRRPKNKSCALLWEFVGGKVEPGETKEQALVRECREELAIEVSVHEEFMTVTHEYPDITVHLTLFCATIKEGVPKLIEHSDLKWITPEEIRNYEFCPADDGILQKIIEEYKARKTGKSFANGFDLPKHMAEHLYMFAGENETDIFRVKK